MKENKYLIQSTKYTALRGKYGIYAQRLLVLLAEAMQYRYENADLRTGKVQELPMQLQWTFKIADLKAGDTNNNAHIKKQLEEAIHATIQWEKENGDWSIATLFTKLDWRNKDGELDIKLNEDLWHIFIELSKGFKKYELETALKFSSAHALKLYQMLSGNKEPITYGINYLKHLFGSENRYKQTNDFIRRNIEKPIQEINEKAEYTVNYEPIYKANGKGRPSIDAIRFTTIRKAGTANTQNSEIVRRYGLSMLPDKLKIKLIESYEFTKQGIKANAQLLEEAYTLMREPTLMEFLDTKRAKAMRAKNPQGWIINAIAGELETLK